MLLVGDHDLKGDRLLSPTVKGHRSLSLGPRLLSLDHDPNVAQRLDRHPLLESLLHVRLPRHGLALPRRSLDARIDQARQDRHQEGLDCLLDHDVWIVVCCGLRIVLLFVEAPHPPCAAAGLQFFSGPAYLGRRAKPRRATHSRHRTPSPFRRIWRRRGMAPFLSRG